jgi:hypothetical protein
VMKRQIGHLPQNACGMVEYICMHVCFIGEIGYSRIVESRTFS